MRKLLQLLCRVDQRLAAIFKIIGKVTQGVFLEGRVSQPLRRRILVKPFGVSQYAFRDFRQRRHQC